MSAIKRRIAKAIDLTRSGYYRKLTAEPLAGGYRRIYLYHIRKTGGTSLNLMFLSLGGEPGIEVYKRLSSATLHRAVSGGKLFVGWDHGLIERGLYHYAFSHTPAHELALPPGTFTLTCLRDPAKRVISHYKMLVKFKRDDFRHTAMDTEGLWLGDSFSDFLDRIPKDHLLNQLYMFSPAYDVSEAADRIAACTHWFLTERFDEGVAELGRKTGLTLSAERTRTTDDIEVAITDAERDRLREMLDPEYRLLAQLLPTGGAERSTAAASG